MSDRDIRLKRLKFRAWHRGTKEADLLVGGFFDRHSMHWDETGTAWFEALLDEQDADIIGWAMGSFVVPDQWTGPMMTALQRLDYIPIAK